MSRDGIKMRGKGKGKGKGRGGDVRAVGFEPEGAAGSVAFPSALHTTLPGKRPSHSIPGFNPSHSSKLNWTFCAKSKQVSFTATLTSCGQTLSEGLNTQTGVFGMSASQLNPDGLRAESWRFVSEFLAAMDVQVSATTTVYSRVHPPSPPVGGGPAPPAFRGATHRTSPT